MSAIKISEETERTMLLAVIREMNNDLRKIAKAVIAAEVKP